MEQIKNLLSGKSLFVVIAVLFIGIAINSSIFTVQYGRVAVLTRFGKIVGDPKDPGLHFKIPFVDDVLEYRTQKIVYETLDDPYTSTSNADYIDFPVDTNTKDGQLVSIRYTIRFSVDPARVKDVANTLGTEAEVVEKIIKADSRIWTRQVPRGFSAAELYTGNLDVVAAEIIANLEPLFKENGIILDEFGIRSITFSPEYTQAIEQKQIAAEKVAYEQFVAEQEKYKKEALITKAQGEAEAQRLQQESLTSELIQKLYIEKWNGELPKVLAGDDNGFILDITGEEQ